MNQLTQLIRERMVLAAGCHDGLSASVAERSGFEAVYLSGYAYAAARGLRDEGYLGLHGILPVVADIQRVCSVPLVVDADDGYGGVAQTRMTVREYCRMGVAAIHIEDQVSPKRSSDGRGKELISVSELTRKVRAAIEARDDSGETLIIGRTDALETSGGSDEARRRVEVMSAAGADLVMVHAVDTLDQLGEIATPGTTPLAITMGHWRERLWTRAALNDHGVRLALLSSPAIRATAKTLKALYSELRRRDDGAADEWFDRLVDAGELDDLLLG